MLPPESLGVMISVAERPTVCVSCNSDLKTENINVEHFFVWSSGMN